MANKKILVTGANGQLGRELQRLPSQYSLFDFVFLSRNDLPIEDNAAVSESFAFHHPDFCINCAAYTAVDMAESEKELAHLINGRAAGILAEACAKNDCRFVHVSTDYVFDGLGTSPYTEEDPVNPQGVYGASKLEGEKEVIRLNTEAVIIRTSWVYSEFGKNFVKTMLKFMGEKEQVNVVNDQFGSPTYAADLAEAIMQIVSQSSHSPGIYHFSNDGVISWYEFAVAIKELSGSKCIVNPIPTSQYPTPANRPLYSVLDKTKIQKVFGISLRNWKASLAVCLQRLRGDV